MFFVPKTIHSYPPWIAALIAHNGALVVCAVVAGMLIGTWLPLTASLLASVFLVAALAIASTLENKWLFFCSLILVAGMGGLYLAKCANQDTQRARLYHHAWLDAIATVISIEQMEHPRFAQKLVVQLGQTHKSTDRTWRQNSDRIVVMSRISLLTAPGDTITFSRLMCGSRKAVDFAQREGAVACAYGFKTAHVLPAIGWSINAWLHHQRIRIWQQCRNVLSPQTFDLFSSIFLGNRQSINQHRQLADQFNQWGLAHYLARAGLHLAFLLMLLSFLMRALMLPLWTRPWASAGLCLGYHALSWPSLPFMRALMAGVLYQACHVGGRSPDALHILHISILSQLFMQPHSLFMLDFQLSYALTYALVLLSRYAGFGSRATIAKS